MCVAIYKPARKTLSKKTLEACSKQHPHGCGFAFIDSENLLQISTQMKFEDFYEEYKEAFRENPDSPFLIHFRYATKGSQTLENCHPFRIDDSHVFMHNGTISNVPLSPKGEDKSDTRMFNELILQQLQPGWNEDPTIRMLIEGFIGASRLVVMNSLGEVRIYNEKDGTWKEGCWFSNMRHEWRLKNGSHNPDGFILNGVRRRWVGNKCEALCPVTNRWRPFDTVTYKFTDNGERFVDAEDRAKALATTEDTTWHKCEYCQDIVQRKDCGVYLTNGVRIISCKLCVQELRGWGMEMFPVVGAYMAVADLGRGV